MYESENNKLMIENKLYSEEVEQLFEQLLHYRDTFEMAKALDVVTHIQEKTGIQGQTLQEPIFLPVIHVAIGTVLWHAHRSEEALMHYRLAATYNERTGNFHGVALALTNIGNVYFSLSEFPEAQKYYLQSLEIKRVHSEPRSIALTLNSLGSTALSLKDFSAAIKYCNESYEMALACNDKLLITQCLHNLGAVHYQLDNLDNALRYFLESLHVCKKQEFRQGIGHSLLNVGVIYAEKSEFSNSITYLEEAIEFLEQTGEKILQAKAVTTLTASYLALGEIEKAKQLTLKHNAIGNEALNATVKASYFNELADIEFRLKNYAQAEEFLEKALTLNQENESIYIKIKSLRLFSDVCAEQQRYQEALTYFQQMFQMKEQQYNAHYDERVRTVLAQFDITLAESEATRKSSERIRLILDSALDAVVTINSHGIVTGWNPQAENIFGWRAEEVEGQLMSDFIVPKHFQAAHGAGMTRFLETRTSRILNQRIEIEARRSTDEVFPVELTIIPIHEKNGETSFCAFIRDITERKKAEKLLKEYNQALEQEVQERTIELHHKHQLLVESNAEAERLLHSIFPVAISERLKSGEGNIVEHFADATIFFSDIVGFTSIADQVSPEELLIFLNGLFHEIDQIATKYGIEKIKTIGDSYMAVAGVPMYFPDHALRAASFAKELLERVSGRKFTKSIPTFSMRIGVHSGSVIAGVIGSKKRAYDVYGDTVNIASRMESHGKPNTIHCSEDFRRCFLSQLEKKAETTHGVLSSFRFIERGEIEIKGKGLMKTFFLE